MFIMKVTPVRNVQIGKRCVKSLSADLFFNKVFYEDSKIDVFDVSDRKMKSLSVNEIKKMNHRMIINDKKYFICSIHSA